MFPEYLRTFAFLFLLFFPRIGGRTHLSTYVRVSPLFIGYQSTAACLQIEQQLNPTGARISLRVDGSGIKNHAAAAPKQSVCTRFIAAVSIVARGCTPKYTCSAVAGSRGTNDEQFNVKTTTISYAPLSAQLLPSAYTSYQA